MPDVQEILSTSILTPQKFGSLSSHYDYTINPYAGCAFACSYCYVPKFPGSHALHEWGSWVNVKVNAPELIRKDKLKIFGSRIFFSSATDPYQYIELKYRLTRRCLKEMLNYPPEHLTMHTRSHLMMQDIDLLREFGSRLVVGISLPTDDDAIRREFEPNAPSIQRRINLMQQLSENGVAVYASVSPLLPCNAERLVELVAPHTSNVRVETMNWLEVMRSPHLLEKYKKFFASENYEATAIKIADCFDTKRERKDSKNRRTRRDRISEPRLAAKQLSLNLNRV